MLIEVDRFRGTTGGLSILSGIAGWESVHLVEATIAVRPPPDWRTRLMARTKPLAALAATALVLGGCGSSTTTPAASAATTQQPPVIATPALTPSPAPTVSPSFDLSPLASQYTGIADKVNMAIAQCSKDAAAAVGSLTKAKAVAQKCLTAYSHYGLDFKAVNWGPAQPQADNVIAAMNTVDTLFTKMAHAADATTFRAERPLQPP